MVKAKPEAQNKIALFTLQRNERKLLLQAFNIIKELDDISDFTTILYEKLTSEHAEVRMMSMELLSNKKDIKLFKLLFQRAQKEDFSLKEAEVIGNVLYRINPSVCFQDMYDWIKPQGLFSFKKISTSKQQKWVAIAALALIDKPEIEKTLIKLKKTASEDISQACTKALYRRNKHLGGT